MDYAYPSFPQDKTRFTWVLILPLSDKGRITMRNLPLRLGNPYPALVHTLSNKKEYHNAHRQKFSRDKIAINASGCRFGPLRRNKLLLSVSDVVVVHILFLSRGFKLSLLSSSIYWF